MRAELTGAARLLELNFRRLPVRCAHASELGALEACGELSSSAPAQLGELSLPLSLSLSIERLRVLTRAIQASETMRGRCALASVLRHCAEAATRAQ